MAEGTVIGSMRHFTLTCECGTCRTCKHRTTVRRIRAGEKAIARPLGDRQRWRGEVEQFVAHVFRVRTSWEVLHQMSGWLPYKF
jgi:hypothetical protein